MVQYRSDSDWLRQLTRVTPLPAAYRKSTLGSLRLFYATPGFQRDDDLGLCVTALGEKNIFSAF